MNARKNRQDAGMRRGTVPTASVLYSDKFQSHWFHSAKPLPETDVDREKAKTGERNIAVAPGNALWHRESVRHDAECRAGLQNETARRRLSNFQGGNYNAPSWIYPQT